MELPPREGCQTRFLKFAHHLQRTTPDLLPPEEPSEGFRSRLEGSDPSVRFLLRDAFAPGKLPPVRAETSGPPFEGSLQLVRLRFQTRKGEYALSRAELEVVRAYLEAALPLLVRYASTLCSKGPAVENEYPEIAPTLVGNRFADGQLREWVGQLAAKAPVDRGFLFLAPRTVVNSDCDISAGSSGYHARGARPYVYVPVQAPPVEVADPGDSFALALSHQILELLADPTCEFGSPERCDPCASSPREATRNFFSPTGTYLGSGT
ncbi:MAG: hypothetical protein ACREDE_11635, partial [Thermoplasmata archaeon]